jgi:transcriptional regulator with XRE-family HTH domain
MKLGRMVAKLRKIIGKSQSQFAAMLGVSKDTIISVENGRNQLSKKLEARITITTGANFRKDGWSNGLEDYTLERFNDFRKEFHESDEETKANIDDVKFWIETIFRAARKSGVGGNRDRFPAVYYSLLEWFRDTRENFRLGPEMEAILEDETRFIKRECEYVGTLKVDNELAEKFATIVGIEYKNLKKELGKYRDQDLMMIKYEAYKLPSFGSTPRYGKPKTPRLMQKPKYWFKKLPKEFVVKHDKPITAKEFDQIKNAVRPPYNDSQSIVV